MAKVQKKRIKTKRKRRGSGISSIQNQQTSNKSESDSLEWINDEEGQITSSEFKQAGFATKSNRLHRSNPVESIHGIGVKKGQALRSQGIKTVGDYQEKFDSKTPKGLISTDEFNQVGLSSGGKLKNHAPIEAVKGIGVSKGKRFRTKGVQTVLDLHNTKTKTKTKDSPKPKPITKTKTKTETKTKSKNPVLDAEMRTKRIQDESRQNPQIMSDFEYDLYRAMRELDLQGRRGGLIPLPMLRREMSNYSRDDFDRELFKLERVRRIDLQTASDPKLLKEPDLAIIHPSRGYINYALIRREWDKPHPATIVPSISDTHKEEPKGKEFQVSPDDIDEKIARNAYRNTYFDPEGRGKTAQKDYAIILTNDYDDLKKHATNPVQEKILADEMERYKKNFISKYEDLLVSHSRLASTHITGASKFPVQRQKKLQGWHENKQKDFANWRKKVKTSIRRKLKSAVTGEEIQKDRDSSLAHDLRQIEASYRAVENKKEWDINPQYVRKLEKSKIYDRLKTLAYNGEIDEVNRQLEIIKTRQIKFGKEFFTKAHKIWNLPQIAQKRVKTIDSIASREPEVLHVFDGGKIINNFEAERVQILFDDKPSEAVRNDLKARGFRWSPKNQAWQRKNTNQAGFTAQRIISSHFKKESSESKKEESKPQEQVLPTVLPKEKIHARIENYNTDDAIKRIFLENYKFIDKDIASAEEEVVNWDNLRREIRDMSADNCTEKRIEFRYRKYDLIRGYSTGYPMSSRERRSHELKEAEEGHVNAIMKLNRVTRFKQRIEGTEAFGASVLDDLRQVEDYNQNLREIIKDRDRLLREKLESFDFFKKGIKNAKDGSDVEKVVNQYWDELKDYNERLNEEFNRQESLNKEFREYGRQNWPLGVDQLLRMDYFKDLQRELLDSSLESQERAIPNNKEKVHEFAQSYYTELVRERNEKAQGKRIAQIQESGKIGNVIAFAGEKLGKVDSIPETWIKLPNGRILKIRRGKIVDKNEKNYESEIKSLKVKSLYTPNDLTDKERYLFAFALAVADGDESLEEYRSNLEFNRSGSSSQKGVMMDKSRYSAMIDRSHFDPFSYSDEDRYTLSDLEELQTKKKDGKDDKVYKLNNTLYSPDTVDPLLKFVSKSKKDYDKIRVLQQEDKPMMILIPDTNLGLLAAPLAPDESEIDDSEPELDDDDDFDDWDS